MLWELSYIDWRFLTYSTTLILLIKLLYKMRWPILIKIFSPRAYSFIHIQVQNFVSRMPFVTSASNRVSHSHSPCTACGASRLTALIESCWHAPLVRSPTPSLRTTMCSPPVGGGGVKSALSMLFPIGESIRPWAAHKVAPGQRSF